VNSNPFGYARMLPTAMAASSVRARMSSAGTEPGITASGRAQAGRGDRWGGAESGTGKDSKKLMLASSGQALRRPWAARAVSMSVR
jgi:hypothetical protein